MRVNFDDEFRKASQGAFPMLKFHSATYIKAGKKLTVRFMIEASAAKNFDSDMQRRVSETVAKMFDKIATAVEYIRTYADDETVRTQIYAFFNKTNRMAYRYLSDDTVKIAVGDEGIKVNLFFDDPTADFLESAKVREQLTEWLYYCFNPPAAVAIRRTGKPSDEVPVEGAPARKREFAGFAPRLIEIALGERIYERGNIGGINQKPGYIADLTSPADLVVVCGKVSGVSMREYRNKKYDPSAPKKQPETLQMVRFSLDDTTGLVECVCFPTPAKVADIERLRNGDTVVCTGKAGISAHTGAISVAVNAVFRCTIDAESLKTVKTRPVPSSYSCIKPQAYVPPQVLKGSLVAYAEDAPEKKTDDPVPAAMLGKTFVVFDFEATDSNMSAVPIELSALKIVDGAPTETFGSLLSPGMPIPPRITELTGINDKMVDGMPSITDILPDFYKFTRGAVLVGHNIDGYDFPLLRKYADKEGYLFDNETCDTLLLARKHFTELRRFSLEELTKHFEIYHADAHRAMADVYATAEILKLLFRRMESEE